MYIVDNNLHYSYRSYPISIASRHIQGLVTGDTDHSPDFPTYVVDTGYQILRERLAQYLTGNLTPNLDCPIPIYVIADKDTSKFRLGFVQKGRPHKGERV